MTMTSRTSLASSYGESGTFGTDDPLNVPYPTADCDRVGTNLQRREKGTLCSIDAPFVVDRAL